MDSDFRVGEWTAQPRLRQIEGPGGLQGVQARSMDVLVDLARHAGEVRTRQELLAVVWGESFVTEEVLSHCIWELRRALGDDARKPHIIQTVPKKGYRLIAPVSWLEATPGNTPRYRLLEKLGSGGMGVVWKAEDTLLHRTVALKFLPEEWSRDNKAKERFVREARIAAALDHANICTLHELAETEDGRLHLVLAYVPGETLRQRLEEGPLPWLEAVRIAAAIARGLAAAHAQGIVHRDIKPANLMLHGDEVKILDFGIARLTDQTRVTQTEVSPGTPAYKSPEQTRGYEVDPRSDLWALGVVLFEMVSGELPFQGGYAEAVVHAILHEEAPSLATRMAGIPPALDELVSGLLTKDPEARRVDAAKMADQLEALLGDGPTTAGAEGTLPKVLETPTTGTFPTAADPSRVKRFRGLKWAVGAVLLLALAVFAAQQWQRPEPEPIRVVVPRPELLTNAPTPALERTASGILVASLNGLARLEGLLPLDPAEAIDAPDTPTGTARAAGADEILWTSIEPQDPLVRLSLRRIRGIDGRVLWSKTLELSARPSDDHLVADHLHRQLQAAYPDHPPRSGVSTLDMQDEDYRLYLEIRRRHALGEPVAERDLESLESLLSTSPRFYEAHLLWADLANLLMLDRRHLNHLDAVMQHIDRAQELVPEAPWALNSRFRAHLLAGRLGDAAKTLEELRILRSNPLALLSLEADLLEAQGNMTEAIERMRQSVDLRPTTTSLLRLANAEVRAGQAEEARDHLHQVLELVPGSPLALSKLAEVELFYGDLATSESLYRQLLARDDRRRNYWSNLGIAQFLQGHFEAAAASYHQALDLAPSHPLVLVNLAGAEWARGNEEAGRAHCRKALMLLQTLAERRPLRPQDALLKAHCLARTDAAGEAVAAVQELLRQHPENAEIAYQAAVIYALTGERLSALASARRARKLGTEIRWFRVPEFTLLANDPEFENLLGAAPAGPA